MAKKKAKRKVARPTLPMQRHLNLRHEGRYFDLRRNFRSRECAPFSRTLARLQSGLGPAPQRAAERIFHLRIHPGRRSRHSDSSAARSALCPAMVSRICALSRDAAFSGARRNEFSRSSSHSHGGILSPRTSFPALSSGASLGRRKSRALSCVEQPTPTPP